MACTSLTALQLACGGTLNQAGIRKAYFVAFSDLENVTGTDEVYTMTGNLISAINLSTGKLFVECGVIAGTAGLAEEGTFDRTTGSGSIKKTFNIQLNGMSSENITWIESLFAQPVAILFKTNNNDYFALGLNGDLYMDSFTGGTGTAAADQIGYKLTLSATDNKLTRKVDPTIVADLINA